MQGWTRSALVILMAVAGIGSAFGQRIEFTFRSHLQCPVLISSIEGSKQFGFDSVVVRNDGDGVARAITFRIIFRGGDVDEIADERHVTVMIGRSETKRITSGLGDVEALRQLARSRRHETGLAILAIESVEFDDGTEWRLPEPQRGVPIDAPPYIPRK